MVRVELSLNVRSDEMWVSMQSDDTADLAETEGDVTRLRLILPGERTFTGDGTSLRKPTGPPCPPSTSDAVHPKEPAIGPGR